MKLNHYFMIAAIVMTSCLAACHENDPTIVPDDPGLELPGGATGTPTEIGQPDGTISAKTIGPEGGTISSADGQVKLTIPAGALTEPTSISVQPITNQNPNGLGRAFRFSPEGLHFRKPASLTFKYNEKELSSDDLTNFGVSYQRSNKVWYDVAGVQVNKNTREVMVPMAHFSDWTDYELAQIEFTSILDNNGGKVRCGESLELAAGLMTYDKNYPKDSLEKPLKQAKNLGVNWAVIGAGKIAGKYNGATYTAPAVLPAANPVLITCDLVFPGKKGKVILMHEVLIVGESYFVATVDGADIESEHFAYIKIADYYLISGNYKGDNEVVSLFIYAPELRAGSYSYWNDKGSKSGKAEVLVGHIGQPVYTSHLWDCQDNRASPGSVTITSVEKIDKKTFISGSYTATVYKTEGLCPNQTVSTKEVKVEFKLPEL
ncbi:hypothetical protein [Dyadobacter sp. CY323]|uniref:hypothetical protein n=1 Tax=Dyadobacter sp. CY323 TaxID=2907302 RepID=UPI001F18A2CC|nr:hypothetical protein [Dyadobacter sp. CY323]MCE6992046.1 hypothetical protein [Dyadobacter sp. CY323]